MGRRAVRLRRQPSERRACASRGCSRRRSPQIQRALAAVDFDDAGEMPEELLVFYHPDTLRADLRAAQALAGARAEPER